jgi:hypothetical protein
MVASNEYSATACSPAHSNLGLALSLGTELGLGRCAIGSEQLAALERL